VGGDHRDGARKRMQRHTERSSSTAPGLLPQPGTQVLSVRIAEPGRANRARSNREPDVALGNRWDVFRAHACHSGYVVLFKKKPDAVKTQFPVPMHTSESMVTLKVMHHL
jgi:hypothetical protein